MHSRIRIKNKCWPNDASLLLRRYAAGDNYRSFAMQLAEFNTADIPDEEYNIDSSY